MTLIEINEMFSTQKRCLELLKRLRWPNGVECPRCLAKKVSFLEDHGRFWCSECSYQFSVTSNTIFHDSHLPLQKWFIAALLLCESRKGISANQLKRMIGVSYKTAWYLCHRIRAAMKDTEPMMLDGVVEMDETYIGGRKRGMGRGPHGKGKEIVIGIRQRGGLVRFFRAADAKSGTLAKFIEENISKDVDVIITDDARAYQSAVGEFADRHFTINHSAKVYVDGTIHTNTVENSFSLLKRGIIGSWHKISPKHLSAYLAEMEFRFNRRNRSDLFLDTLRHMVTSQALTFEKLTG